ncbi:hypothetical protein NEDG_01971 [Nematocida displodere]|uniref:Disease resistance R13L4/SHOC-2-like LRR domain-containing protein n=1 Tax=Nematocida displodere TaxID=1805483 RepID=A0A177EHJ1_9MICR|nr:hypothetical protein NEDG_01971 [Nematocida displodere]
MGTTFSAPGQRIKIGERYRNTSQSTARGMAGAQETLGDIDENFPGKEIEPVFVPKKITDFHLYMCKSRIFRLDKDIRSLRGIRILQICCNYIEALPSEIGELSELVILFLARNRLRSLPDSLSQLAHLKEMNVSDNLLVTLPHSLRKLRSLECLDLSGNPMSELPLAVPHIRMLKSLSVASTQIRYFPPEIFQLMFLTDFYVPGPSSLEKVLQRTSREAHLITYIQDTLVVQRKTPLPLVEKVAQKIITTTRAIRKDTPTHVLQMLLAVKECHVCGNPLFSAFTTIFTKTAVCDKEIRLIIRLCRNHPFDYANPLLSLRESMFAEREYLGDRVVPSIAFIFDFATYGQFQRQLLLREEKKFDDDSTQTVHLLLLNRVLSTYHS